MVVYVHCKYHSRFLLVYIADLHVTCVSKSFARICTNLILLWNYNLPCSAGGNAKFVLLVCVSPTVQYLAESTRVMGFGSRARQVQRGPTKSQKSNLKWNSNTCLNSIPVVIRVFTLPSTNHLFIATSQIVNRHTQSMATSKNLEGFVRSAVAYSIAGSKGKSDT